MVRWRRNWEYLAAQPPASSEDTVGRSWESSIKALDLSMTPEFKKKFLTVQTPMMKEEYEDFIDVLAKLCTRLYLREIAGRSEQGTDKTEVGQGSDGHRDVG